MNQFLVSMVVGILVGAFTRVLMMQTSYRQYPSRPHGYIIQLFLGLLASLLGALVIPAIIKPDFTAGVFVSLGTAQFHTMRELERKSWTDVDKGELIPRGAAYIEGMATAFEARIFMVLGVSAITTLCCHLFHWVIGTVIGVLLAIALRLWKQGRSVSDLATARVASVSLESNQLLVDGEQLHPASTFQNQNSEDEHGSAQRSVDKQGDSVILFEKLLGIVVEPKDFSAILTLAHRGQQQAILHNLSVAVGVQTHPLFKSSVAFYPEQRKLLFVLMPVLKDTDVAIESVLGAPILEGVFKKKIVHT